MPSKKVTLETNRLLSCLPQGEYKKILQHCKTVELVFGSTLCEPDQPYEYAYFPLSGFISLVTTLAAHQPLEMGLIGNEGMLGATLLLDTDRTPMRAVVQGAGTALQIDAHELQQQLLDCPILMKILQRYLYVSVAQLSQNYACTHFHEIAPRLARWLLMTHDRAHSEHFHLTHELLADMLGVRRSGITIAAGELQKQNLISYTRGNIHILDRAGLEEASCECYQALIDDYQQLFDKNTHSL